MQHYQLMCKGELNWKNVLLIINKLLHIICGSKYHYIVSFNVVRVVYIV